MNKSNGQTRAFTSRASGVSFSVLLTDSKTEDIEVPTSEGVRGQGYPKLNERRTHGHTC